MIYHEKRPILYVDDTVEQRYAMRRILESEGFSILEAGSGHEALALLEPRIALAVVDVKLPDINGYDLSRKLRELEPHLPILQVSASFRDPEQRAAGLSGEADAYIAQPVHPPELLALIRRMLKTSEAEDSLRFLAKIAPRITSSLSLDETAENIRNAMVPAFADHCAIYLRGFSGQPSSFWSKGKSVNSQYRHEIELQATEKSIRRVNSRLVIAPLSLNDTGLGAITFELENDREYTNTDLILATDLAIRAGLALQNCILFSSEQSTRAALIQAEKLATAGRMSAAIAHEINNPLEALTNLIYIIEQSAEVSPAIRETASTALSEVTRLAHIARRSLGFYKEMRSPAIMDLSESVRDTLELYEKRISSSEIEIKLDLAESVLIQGIKGEIRQVISNLLVNALEAVDIRGVISIATFKEDNRACLSISDDGPGVEGDVEKRIFEPFFTTKQGTGTGLGLWITQSIIQKHNGTIAVYTRASPDHGCTFKIEIPIAVVAENGSGIFK